MTNPTNPPAQRIEPDQRKNASKTISGADVQAVLLEIDKLVSDHDVRHFEDAGDEEKGVQYERVLSFRFPEDIQNEFNIRYIEVPVRKLLQWAAAELPDDAETINAIRDEYYGGDEPEDHQFGVSEFTFRNTPPTIEEMAIKRVARAAGRKERDARRLGFEIGQAEQAIRDSEWQIDQLEGRSTPLEIHMEQCNKDRAEIGAMYGELHDAWDKFVAERQDKNDPEFDASTRAKLMTCEQTIGDTSTARRIVRDAEFKALMAEKASAAEKRNAA
ncbi:hypothetical protein [Mesorhizobium sp. M0058]|uniref:hypothetical protein n=1 Tax=Mesorhizobium sp. M0058 TaxID=2956865 RepID=UPI00333C4E14